MEFNQVLRDYSQSSGIPLDVVLNAINIACSPTKSDILKKVTPDPLMQPMHKYFVLYHDEIFTPSGAIVDDRRLQTIITAVNMLSSRIWFNIDSFCFTQNLPHYYVEWLLGLLYNDNLMCRVSRWIPLNEDQIQTKGQFFKLKTCVYDDCGDLLLEPTESFIKIVRKLISYLND